MTQNVIKSVSMPVELAEFLDRNPELSLSKIVQVRLIEIKEAKVQFESRLKVYENKMRVLQEKLMEANEELDKLKGGNVKNG